MVYDIALGNTRKDTSPKQYKWEWGEIEKRLRNVTYCEHTMAQYTTMTKVQRIDAKDVGYFIGGLANKRKVAYRQILSLDIDEATDQTLDDLRAWLNGHTYIIHTTHSSTPENPRYRVVAPLSRLVQADEYGALMRVLHDSLQLPLDVATFDFNRIMFTPSVPKDADYFFESKHGKPLSVDDLLGEDWQDLSKLDLPKKAKQVQDPKFKGGIIGAFCSLVPIREAIAIHLSDVWRLEDNGRYTYKDASTFGGGIIYEDKYLYSNHSTDPYMGRSHNAYDAVRLYKFGDGKRSEAAMLALCESLGIKPDSGTRHALTIEAMEDEDAKRILDEQLDRDAKGQLVKSLKNAELILSYDPNIRDIFAYDLFQSVPVLKRPPIWRTFDLIPDNEDCRNLKTYTEIEDLDESFLRLYFEEHYDFQAHAVLQDALNIVGHKNKFHPVCDYLNSLQWDGTARREKIFIDCFGVPDTVYAREVGLKFFVGAVRRVFMPASKMDYIPVLVSEEGLGKSRFIKRMGKLWGSDTFYTFNGSKEAYEQLRGVWIMEIPELNGVQSRSTNSRKAFVTKTSDRYRSAYLKYTKTYNRQCVFIGSSNDVVFLDDPNEDGRRWWGMICRKEHITVDVHSDDFLDRVDHYWAEAVHYYLQGVKPVLSPAAESEAISTRKVHKAEDLELGALEDYLNMPVPPDWREKNFFERNVYIEGALRTGKPRDYICNAEVAREFFRYDRKEMTSAVGRKVADAIERTKLFERTGENRRFGDYGSAPAWKRIGAEDDVKAIRSKKKKDKL